MQQHYVKFAIFKLVFCDWVSAYPNYLLLEAKRDAVIIIFFVKTNNYQLEDTYITSASYLYFLSVQLET